MRPGATGALLALGAFAAPLAAHAAPGLTLMHAAPAGGGGEAYSLDVQTLLIITALAFLPAIILLMTGFTRIIIVLAILRQALGLSQTPPNLVLIGLALALTAFVMHPVISRVNGQALQPYLAGNLGFKAAVARAETPLRGFMQRQTRKGALHLFVDMNGKHYRSVSQVPFTVLVPAFATSELQTAFQLGFLIYIPFVLIDLAVSSILMSLGMIMLSPMLISLPLKLLLFVSISGWDLVLGSLARSFVH
ncbi:MAG TPA: flagellar type III secretion system pore protein FliP [Gammaproteobacteria bacterium]|nr:flagellar type III secretion system pore protein FliP [Gammaproteobacteria bacterium]